MPDPNQTPASRRFLPPSSSSRTRQQSSTQKSQFGRPSQISSSSPFLRTPFHKQTERRDEIETSFEDDEAELPSIPAPAQSPSVNPRHQGRDIIEDNRDHRTTGQQSTRQSRFTTNTDEDDDVDSIPNIDFSSPLPKRQKLSHGRQTHHPADAIPISSSPSPSDRGLARMGDEDGSDNDLNNDHDILPDAPAYIYTTDHQPDPTSSSPPSQNDDDNDDLNDPQPLDTITTTKPRFRIHPPAPLPTIDLTQPQSQSRSPIQPHSITRPTYSISASAFKPLHQAQELSMPLPATFSPSRRKGRNEYIYNGAAETVRGWILDVANEQLRTGDGDTDSRRRMEAEDVLQDGSGRFDLVRRVTGDGGGEEEIQGGEGEGELWMLVHQEHIPRVMSGSRRREVVLKGTGTTWDLDLDLDPASPRESDQVRRIKVAVLWERGRSGEHKK